ncbi:MAG: hypothetical protein M3395_09945, partial [Chloroflexota bacterium]|nr:hypothetical protein [Chloroflexota bacterium]
MSEAQRGARRASPPASPSSPRSFRRFLSDHHLGRGASLRFLISSALAGMLVSAAGTPAAAHHPSFHTDADASARVTTGLDLRPGDLVEDDGISVVVPERGHMIWGELKFEDGTYRMLSAETDRGGSVRLLRWGDEAAGIDADLPGMTGLAGVQALTSGTTRPTGTLAQPDGSGGSSECSDGAYSRFSFRMPHLEWRYASGTTPSKFRNRTDGTKQVINALKRANRNVTGARNLCGRSDRISAQGTYLGTTKLSPNISSSGSCTGGDGHSVIGWGSLPSGSIAMACVSGISGGVAYEGDIRINWNKAYETKKRYCSGELLIEAAMTHEFGHLYGMAHVSSYSSPHLTMQPRVGYCSMGHARLGLG